MRFDVAILQASPLAWYTNDCYLICSDLGKAQLTFDIPQCIEDGEYLFRIEHVALHSASSPVSRYVILLLRFLCSPITTLHPHPSHPLLPAILFPEEMTHPNYPDSAKTRMDRRRHGRLPMHHHITSNHLKLVTRQRGHTNLQATTLPEPPPSLSCAALGP